MFCKIVSVAWLFPAVDQLGVIAGVELFFRRGLAFVFILNAYANPEAFAISNGDL